ncbi:MAG: hypothetical protein GTN98_11335 [Woeseiaceae bacterium]|nr:hypothetical protein [Woeseiaceae bacterium]
MNSHNPEKMIKDETVRIESDDGSVRILRADLVGENDLSIDEGFDLGGDPYNSTGRHVIIKPKTNLED